MTLADIESVIATMKLADLSSGEYVSKGKLMDYETRAKKAEKALAEKLTEEEKAQIELAKREEWNILPLFRRSFLSRFQALRLQEGHLLNTKTNRKP